MSGIWESRWVRGGLRVLAAVAIAYALGLLAIFVFQARLIFVPDRLPADYRFEFIGSYEERMLPTEPEGGPQVSALHFRTDPDAEAGGSRAIVYMHGNAGSLAGWGEVALDLVARTGLDVWIVDYPGYGKSEGGLSGEASLHAAASALYDAALADVGGNEARLVVFGRSIGTGPAVRLASERHPSRLVLESPYLSVRQLARERLPWVPGFLLRFPLRSDEFAPGVSCPTLVLHGDRDEVIPFEHGRKLATLFKEGTFAPIAGGSHNDLGLAPSYWTALQAFLKRP